MAFIYWNIFTTLSEGQGTDLIMNISEQQSLQNIDVGSLASVVGTQLGAALFNNNASKPSLQLPLISPEVIKLSGIRPNDDSQEQTFDDDGIGISQR